MKRFVIALLLLSLITTGCAPAASPELSQTATVPTAVSTPAGQAEQPWWKTAVYL